MLITSCLNCISIWLNHSHLTLTKEEAYIIFGTNKLYNYMIKNPNQYRLSRITKKHGTGKLLLHPTEFKNKELYINKNNNKTYECSTTNSLNDITGIFRDINGKENIIHDAVSNYNWIVNGWL